MTWRTIYITKQCHLTFKANYILVRGEDVQSIYIPEVHTLMIDSNMVTISTYLLNELMKAKVKVVLCDEKHNPSGELIPLNGSHDASKKVHAQIEWNPEICDSIWKAIVQAKIRKQAEVLQRNNRTEYEQLLAYIPEVQNGDVTNREGFAAKVYFNALYGMSFKRDDKSNDFNAVMNYGYAILLSMVNREVVNCGYLTMIGIHHRGPTNQFNLSCDLMEPFRPIVDQFALDHAGEQFDKELKVKLIAYLNDIFIYQGKNTYFPNMIATYVKGILSAIEKGKVDDRMFDYGFNEKQVYADSGDV